MSESTPDTRAAAQRSCGVTRLLRACGVTVALLALAGCEIDKTSIPRTDALVALHAVLSATAPSQVVLLERTRNGSVQLIAPPFDLADPVVSDEGIAESGANITLVTPVGQTLAAREDVFTRGDGKGAGIYRFELPGSTLVRGGVYRLTVRTSKGESLTAETTVPVGAAAPAAEARSFDRASDTLTLEWPASPGARSYVVRVETPWGPRTFFTDSTRVRLPGLLRNVDVDDVPRVFVPGFPQAVTVSAVDGNYYDWYRTHDDALSGSGLVSRVSGGIGVFGSLVRLRFLDLHTVAPQAEPIAGRWRFAGSDAERATTPYLALEVYVESPAARSGQPDALSGRFDKRPSFGNPGCQTCGLLGTVRDGKVQLHFLRAWYASDTAETMTGELRGDTLVGSYRGFGGIARFVKE